MNSDDRHVFGIGLCIVSVAMLGFAKSSDGGSIHTANVEVINSTSGQFVPLEVDTPWEAYHSSRWKWQSIANVLQQQPQFSIWQVAGDPPPGGDRVDSDPSPVYGKISFTVLTDGPVMLAVTNRWGGGGNSGGNWIPELTTEVEFLADGWIKLPGILDIFDHSLGTLTSEQNPPFYYETHTRDSHAGETFTYRTEKYHPPAPLTTQFHASAVPEPSLLLLAIVGAMGVGVAPVVFRRWQAVA